MLEFTRLKSNLKKCTEGFPAVRVAVLCDYASQHLVMALQGYGIDREIAFHIHEGDYDQIEQQVFDDKSALYAAAPEFVLLSKNSYKLLDAFYATPVNGRAGFAERTVRHLQALAATVQQRCKATVILTNFLELNDAVFGHYAANVPVSFLYQVRKLNLLMMEAAQTAKGLFIADVQTLALETGLQKAVDQKNLLRADMPWSLAFLPALAQGVTGLIAATRGSFKKCIVLDLDNTLWGGVIGDDGLEGIELGNLGNGKAFSRLQQWVKELGRRGIIVCICSKNREATAKEVFERHPDSILKTDDISVFAVNWNNKVDNLHFIQRTLNIGFDAMVFVDDNPFERGMVKEAIPALTVPELPEDPVDYLPYLQSLNLFETASYTAEDGQRANLYQQEAERVAHQQVYKNEADYLQGLQMKADVKGLTEFVIPRAAQLSQRSNQFNLRTVRYTEADLQGLAAAPDYFPLAVSLADRFGDYGLICFVVLKKEDNALFIENWMMSCRVLKRGVEAFVLNEIVVLAKKESCIYIVGEYLPTAKNALVKDHYLNLGFEEKDGRWILAINDFTDHKTAVQKNEKVKAAAFIPE